MKRLPGLLIVASLLTMTTGCPPMPGTEAVKPPPAKTPPDKTTPAPPAPPAETTVKGMVTKVEKDQITIKDDAGKEQVLAIGADTKVTLDGKEVKPEEIKSDSTIAAVKTGDKVTKIEAKAPAAPAPPAETTVKGTVTKAEKDKVAIKDEGGKEQVLAVTAETKVTLDGKDVKPEELKTDSSITATKKGDAVIRIEAKAPAAPPPADTTVTGKVVTAEKGKITVTVDGKDKAFTVPEGAKVTIDGADGKLEDAKKDNTAVITSKADVVTKVEIKTK